MRKQGDRAARERTEKVVVDLLRAQSQLIPGLRHLEYVDRSLIDAAADQARSFLQDLRLGEMRVEYWKPPAQDADDDLEKEFG